MRLHCEQALWVSIGTLGVVFGCGEASSAASPSVPSSSLGEVGSGDLQGDAGSGPPARMAVTIELAACGVDGQYLLPEDDLVVELTKPDISGTQLEQLPRMVNGREGASVACSVVQGEDNRLSFSASAALGDLRRFTLSMGGSSVPSGAGKVTGSAEISFLHPFTIPGRTGSGCDVSVAVAGPGELLVDFVCTPPNSTFNAIGIDTPTCQAAGTLVMDRCATEE